MLKENYESRGIEIGWKQKQTTLKMFFFLRCVAEQNTIIKAESSLSAKKLF